MKPETQKLTVFILFLAIVSVAIYYLVFNKKDKPKTYVVDHSTTSDATTATTSTSTTTALFPIKRGMKGKYVLALQKGLNRSFKAGLVEDGDYGKNTYDAVVKHIDTSFYSSKWTPSVHGVLWSQFVSLGFDKLV